MRRRKKKTSLIKVVFILFLLFAAAVGVYRAWQWYEEEYVGAKVTETSAVELAAAEEHLQAGRNKEALEIARHLAEYVQTGPLAPAIHLFLARAYQANGRVEDALKTLERFLADYPSSPDRPKGLLHFARILESTGRYEQANQVFQEVCDTAPAEFRALALSGLGRELMRQGDLLSARDHFREATQAAVFNSPEWDEAVDELGRVNIALVFSSAETPEREVYTVASGDTLYLIRRNLNVTAGLLRRANNIEGDHLSIGQRLFFTRRNFHIYIERSTCRLFVVDRNGLFKRYYVGLGKPGYETTLGSYKIGQDKMEYPTWRNIPYGDPRNELGTRWMPLNPVEEGLPNDLGIHGTIAPETIGFFSSLGCARMHNEDAEELYDLIVPATPVDIVEEVTPAMLAPESVL